MLVASWNTPGPYTENNIDMHEDEQYAQYNPSAPGYSELQPYGNRMWNHGSYNNPMIQGPSNIEAPTYQYNPPVPGYSELQPYGNRMWNHGSYNNPMIQGPSNIEAPTYQYNPSAPGYSELQPYGNCMRNHEPYNNPMMWGSYNTGMPATGEPEERVNRREIETPIVDQLVAESRQTEQNMYSKIQPSVDGYGRRTTEIIDEQETAGMDIVEDNSEEMPIPELIEDYEPYDIPEQSHSLLVTQTIEGSPYEYSNSTFIDKLLHSPSPFIMSDAIRMRFSGLFLSFLSSEQVIRLLLVLLENKLGLSKKDQKEFIETIFGHIDYSLELVIAKAQVIMLIEAIMRSRVPNYFEQVFLTWKMWYSFTVEDQEKMLKYFKKEHKREILVMLYLFVINRDEANSQQCEIFKNNIKNQYKEIGVFKDGYTLKDVVIKMDNRNVEVLHIILNTFDTCLLDLPEVFKSMDENTVIAFRDFFNFYFFSWRRSDEPQFFRYKSHVCYALTKFTREFKQANDVGKSNVSRLYFEPVYIKYEFKNWIRILKKNNNVSTTTSVDEREKGFVNAFAVFRQITQSDKYNFDLFFKLFNRVDVTRKHNKPYLTLLFSLTNENILKELGETPEWIEYIKKKSVSLYSHRYIENFSINNANSKTTAYLKYIAMLYVTKMHEDLVNLIAKGGIIMHREYYFYRRLLFHPQFRIFNGMSMIGYIEGLNKIGLLNNREQRDQIARDLVFSEYYHKATKEILECSPKKGFWLLEFKKSIEKELEIHKNKEDIEKE
ncbi:hypothetical protein PAEPH01_2100, partial [Pancytospora epiphaga]